MAKKQKKLSVPEMNFVEAFAEIGDIKEAAAKAKISIRTGYRLKNHPMVQQLVREATERAALKLELSREKMMQDFIDIKKRALEDNPEYPNHAAALKANEMLCKMLGYFEPDKSEQKDISVSISVINEKEGGNG
jgi:hypothetical protein